MDGKSKRGGATAGLLARIRKAAFGNGPTRNRRRKKGKHRA